MKLCSLKETVSNSLSVVFNSLSLATEEIDSSVTVASRLSRLTIFLVCTNGWRGVGAFLLRAEGMDHVNFDGIAPSARKFGRSEIFEDLQA